MKCIPKSQPACCRLSRVTVPSVCYRRASASLTVTVEPAAGAVVVFGHDLTDHTSPRTERRTTHLARLILTIRPAHITPHTHQAQLTGEPSCVSCLPPPLDATPPLWDWCLLRPCIQSRRGGKALADPRTPFHSQGYGVCRRPRRSRRDVECNAALTHRACTS